MIPSPCSPECGCRSMECRLSCSKYKVYAALKKKEYAERQQQNEIRNAEYERKYLAGSKHLRTKKSKMYHL